MNSRFNRDALQINVTGRVMMVLTHCRVSDMQRLPLYVSAVTDAVERALVDHPDRTLNELIDEQLLLLEKSIFARSSTSPAAAVDEGASAADRQGVAEAEAAEPTFDDSTVLAAEPEEEPADDAGEEPAEPPVADRSARQPLGGAAPPVVRSMEEKLVDRRKPIQKLVQDECVTAGLLSADKAKVLVAGMAGKRPEDAETEIVEYLREALLQQVKSFMRKTKGGPWSAPRVQAELRADIHHARTVRGVLTLSRQVIEERRAWEKANGKGGILGLFAGRH